MGEPLLNDHMTSAISSRPITHPRRLLVIDRDAEMRPAFEDFLRRRYEDVFGARLRRHYPLIAGLLGRGGLVAAAGVRFAGDEPLFLEQYLDQPVEAALTLAHGEAVGRDEVVEIGSLASVGPMAALDLFRDLADWLMSRGACRFAVATVTPRLRSLLSRTGAELATIAEADPARVAWAGRDWGSYYEGGATVVSGRIGMPPGVADPGFARQGRVAARRAQ